MATTTTTSTTTSSSTTTTTSTTTSAMATLNPTLICNMALNRIGNNKTLTNVITDSSVEAQVCRRHYDQTRKALLRSHFWRFARARKTLSTSSTPAFEWDYQFNLPTDWIRMIGVYESESAVHSMSTNSYALEGRKILTDSSSLYIRYIKNIGDVNLMDELFIEVFVLTLAKKLIKPLAQDDKNSIQKSIDDDLIPLMRKVRALDREEAVHVGRADKALWNENRQVQSHGNYEHQS